MHRVSKLWSDLRSLTPHSICLVLPAPLPSPILRVPLHGPKARQNGAESNDSSPAETQPCCHAVQSEPGSTQSKAVLLGLIPDNCIASEQNVHATWSSCSDHIAVAYGMRGLF